MVGDPGIEPGVSRLEGVTVPCHTLRPVAQPVGLITGSDRCRQHENRLRTIFRNGMVRALVKMAVVL